MPVANFFPFISLSFNKLQTDLNPFHVLHYGDVTDRDVKFLSDIDVAK